MVLFTLIAIFSILSFSIKSKRGAQYLLHHCSDLNEITKIIVAMALFCDVNLFFSTKPIFPNFSATHVRLICCVFFQKWKIAIKHVMALILIMRINAMNEPYKLEPNRNNGAKNIAHPVFFRKTVKCDVMRQKKRLTTTF